ncbi:salicylaldehyde dehydrogenase [Xylariales sp. PMI_506]|nr:salicylaldehyde dehydrogenase [Xylariales sp. PMI_506]
MVAQEQNGNPSFALITGGEDVPTESTFEVLDPITQGLVHVAPAATEEQAVRAVEDAERAFETWRDSTPLERRDIFLKAARIMDERKPELIAAMVQETGAKPSWAAFNIKTAIGFVLEGAGMVTQIKGEILQSNDHGTLAMVFKEPCGVILGIAPWNAPIILGVRAFITPLVCGNTVVLKASESSPLTQYLVVDCFRRAGLPAGVLNFICCPRTSAGKVTEAMVGHAAVQRVNFTGSTAVGRIIATMCAKYLKPVVLELGGKAPMVILKDANLEEAVRAAAFGAMQHQGQICMSTERIIIHKSVAQRFAELFKAKVDTMKAANPSVDSSTALGSLINPTAGKRVGGLIDDALAKGASIQGGTHKVEGSIVQPLVLGGITKDMDIYYQESFGPVVSLFEFETNEEAIRLANDTEYGLVSSVFSDNITEALAVARKIRSGSCHINGATVHDEPHLPLGGQKASGYGRFGGSACINEFTEDRVVTIVPPGHFYPI